MFTSVDLANKVKKDGSWIRNREVAAWLRQNINANSGPGVPTYDTTMIDVEITDNGVQTTVEARLYHPMGTDPDLYTGTDAVAVTPDDFAKMHPAQNAVNSAVAGVTAAATTASTVVADAATAAGRITGKLQARFSGTPTQIAQSVSKKLGSFKFPKRTG